MNLKNKNISNGERLVTDILHHTRNMGGSSVFVYGKKGCGKTTLLLTLAKNIVNENIVNESVDLKMETILWNGNSSCEWNKFPKERATIFIHEKNDSVIKIGEKELCGIELPDIIKYKTVGDLYKKLKRNHINVIYEPSIYIMNNKIKNIIIDRYSIVNKSIFDNYNDTSVFWIELIDYMRKYNKSEFMSYFMDNGESLLALDQLNNQKWYMRLFFKDIMRELRRRHISLYVSCNSCDKTLLPQIRYDIYLQKIGEFIIKRGDIWGRVKFDKFINL
jgi:hypothetical protein